MTTRAEQEAAAAERRRNPATKAPVIPFTEDEKYWIAFRAMQQAGQVIATCISQSNFTASEIDYICGFKKGYTLRLLNKLLDWDGKWPGPTMRPLALIARACGFRLDFVLEEDDSRFIPQKIEQPEIQPPEGCVFTDEKPKPNEDTPENLPTPINGDSHPPVRL